MPGRNPHISAHGGLDVLISHLHKIRYRKDLDAAFGKRHYRAKYSYSDVILTWTMNMLAGCNRLEQTYQHREQFLNHPRLQQGMSPDTISRVVKHFAVQNSYYTYADKKHEFKNIRSFSRSPDFSKLHEVNLNMPLNTLLLKTAMRFGLIKPGQGYEVDIDATIISSKVSDGRRHYKDGNGYIPMVVMLGGIPIFMEARNGNSGAAMRKLQVLREAISLFKEHGIKISLVRIDAAGATQDILNYLHRRGLTYVIRARDKSRVKEIGVISEKAKSSPDKMVSKDRLVKYMGQELRLVEYKRQMADGEMREWGILTNNQSLSSKEVIHIYNQRGAMEQRFADLKEMGWHYMVHRELKYNAVHMQITMLAYIMFIYSKKWLASCVKTIKETIKPQTFIKKFIQVITIWKGDRIIFLTREREFKPLDGVT